MISEHSAPQSPHPIRPHRAPTLLLALAVLAATIAALALALHAGSGRSPTAAARTESTGGFFGTLALAAR